MNIRVWQTTNHPVKSKLYAVKQRSGSRVSSTQDRRPVKLNSSLHHLQGRDKPELIRPFEPTYPLTDEDQLVLDLANEVYGPFNYSKPNLDEEFFDFIARTSLRAGFYPSIDNIELTDDSFNRGSRLFLWATSPFILEDAFPERATDVPNDWVQRKEAAASNVYNFGVYLCNRDQKENGTLRFYEDLSPDEKKAAHKVFEKLSNEISNAIGSQLRSEESNTTVEILQESLAEISKIARASN